MTIVERIRMALAGVLLLCMAAPAAAGEGQEPIEVVQYLQRSGCGFGSLPEEDGKILTLARERTPSYLGPCGSLSGNQELEYVETFVASSSLGEPAGDDGLPLTLDSGRPISGVLSLAVFREEPSGVQVASAGVLEVTVVLQGVAGTGFVLATDATLVLTPATTRYEVPFSFELPAELHGRSLTDLSLSYLLLGSGLAWVGVEYNGASYLTLPAADAESVAVAPPPLGFDDVEVAVEGGARVVRGRVDALADGAAQVALDEANDQTRGVLGKYNRRGANVVGVELSTRRDGSLAIAWDLMRLPPPVPNGVVYSYIFSVDGGPGYQVVGNAFSPLGGPGGTALVRRCVTVGCAAGGGYEGIGAVPTSVDASRHRLEAVIPHELLPRLEHGSVLEEVWEATGRGGAFTGDGTIDADPASTYVYGNLDQATVDRFSYGISVSAGYGGAGDSPEEVSYGTPVGIEADGSFDLPMPAGSGTVFVRACFGGPSPCAYART